MAQCAQRRSGAVDPVSPTDKVSRGRRREHRRGDSNMLDKVAVVGAHSSGGSMVRGKKGGDSSTFQGGGGVRWPGRVATRSCSRRRTQGR
jgi:hypothetical protein